VGTKLPFRLKIPKEDQIKGMDVTSKTFRVHGFLEVHEDLLIIEWGGTVNVQEVGMMGVRAEAQTLHERLEVPVADLYRAELTGGWFRPRLTVQARTVGALAPVPTEEFGVVNFWYDRSERFTAVAVAAELGEAIAAAS
jgi:hypothetical protein